MQELDMGSKNRLKQQTSIITSNLLLCGSHLWTFHFMQENRKAEKKQYWITGSASKPNYCLSLTDFYVTLLFYVTRYFNCVQPVLPRIELMTKEQQHQIQKWSYARRKNPLKQHSWQNPFHFLTTSHSWWPSPFLSLCLPVRKCHEWMASNVLKNQRIKISQDNGL